MRFQRTTIRIASDRNFFTWLELKSLEMVLENFILRKRRKVHPHLLFERCTSNQNTFESEPGVRGQRETRTTANEPAQKISKSHLILLEQIKVSSALAKANAAGTSKKRKRTPTAEEMKIRRGKVLRTLNQWRDAICKEMEKSWFIEGAYLEKHRHNLLVTHKLEQRGLMWL